MDLNNKQATILQDMGIISGGGIASLTGFDTYDDQDAFRSWCCLHYTPGATIGVAANITEASILFNQQRDSENAKR